MAQQTKGTLTITSIRDDKAREEAAAVLAEARGQTAEVMAEKLSQLPFELSTNIPESDAQDIIRFMRTMGIKARYSPRLETKQNKPQEEEAEPKARPRRPQPTAQSEGLSGMDFNPGAKAPKRPSRPQRPSGGGGLGGMDFTPGKKAPKRPAQPSRPSRPAGGSMDFRPGKKPPRARPQGEGSSIGFMIVPGALFLLATALLIFIALSPPA